MGTGGIQKFRQVSGQLRRVWSWLAEAQPHDSAQGCVLVMAEVALKEKAELWFWKNTWSELVPDCFPTKVSIIGSLSKASSVPHLRGHLPSLSGLLYHFCPLLSTQILGSGFAPCSLLELTTEFFLSFPMPKPSARKEMLPELCMFRSFVVPDTLTQFRG